MVSDYKEVKMKTFLAETSKDGRQFSNEVKAETLEDAKKVLAKDGYAIYRIVAKRGNHICQYCGSITYGSDKDILCDTCCSDIIVTVNCRR